MVSVEKGTMVRPEKESRGISVIVWWDHRWRSWVGIVRIGGGRCASGVTWKPMRCLVGTRCGFSGVGVLCNAFLGRGVVDAMAHAGLPWVGRSRRQRLPVGYDIVAVILCRV